MEEVTVFHSQEDPNWVNKTRTLIVSSRGMTANQRALMLSLFALMPHAKKDCKLEKDSKDTPIQMLRNRSKNFAPNSRQDTSSTSRSRKK